MNNKYVNRSKISEAKFRDLVRFFSLDLTAIQIAELTGLNRNTVNRYLAEIRRKITRFSEVDSPSSFSKKADNEAVKPYSCLILMKADGDKIFTDIAAKAEDNNRSCLHNDFDLLIDMENGCYRYLKQNNTDNQQYLRKMNSLERFWGNAKSRLAKFKGIHSSNFRYHLKECEFRYNHRGEDLYQLLLKILRKDPLF